jgi:hypothetical protein
VNMSEVDRRDNFYLRSTADTFATGFRNALENAGLRSARAVAAAAPEAASAAPAAADAGQIVYHGTNADTFTAFEAGRGRTAQHIYTSPKRDDAAQYGSNVIEATVEGSVGNFVFDENGFTADTVNQLRRAYREGGLDSYWSSFADFIESFENGRMYQEFSNSSAQDATVEALLNLGYDAVRIPDAGFGGSMSVSIAARDPSVFRVVGQPPTPRMRFDSAMEDVNQIATGVVRSYGDQWNFDDVDNLVEAVQVALTHVDDTPDFQGATGSFREVRELLRGAMQAADMPRARRYARLLDQIDDAFGGANAFANPGEIDWANIQRRRNAFNAAGNEIDRLVGDVIAPRGTRFNFSDVDDLADALETALTNADRTDIDQLREGREWLLSAMREAGRYRAERYRQVLDQWADVFGGE